MIIPPPKAMEPINMFGRELDRAAVARRMREITPNVELDAARDDGWHELTALEPEAADHPVRSRLLLRTQTGRASWTGCAATSRASPKRRAKRAR